eukprot:171001_1
MPKRAAVKRIIRPKAQQAPIKPVGKDQAKVWIYPVIVYILAIASGIFLQFCFPIPALGFRIHPYAIFGLGYGGVSFFFVIHIWNWQLFSTDGQSMTTTSATTRVIKGGPYKYSRNPEYMAFTCLIVGLSFVLESYWMAAVALPTFGLVHFLVVLPEERYLAKKFTANYLSYKNRTPRYLPDEVMN